jgi:microcystin-dependent protein
MSDPYTSQIEAFAFGVVPRGWLQCAGQTLPINQYQALFSLLGTTYGGNGTTTFMLPDLRGRTAIGLGQGNGLSNYVQGQQAGQENVTLSTANMPAAPHTHAMNANAATTGGTAVPATNCALSSGYTATATTPPTNTPVPIYSTAAPTVPMGTLSPTGGQPHNNLMPFLAVNYCICISGIFPSRG